MHLALADYAKIVESGALKVAVYKSFAPFSEPERGDAGGLDVALAGALARELGVKLSLMPFDAGETMSDDLRNMVWRGHYLGYGPADVMLHVPVDSRFMERNDRVLIFAPYYRERLVLVHDRSELPSVRSIEDLVGHKVAAEQGTAAASALLGVAGGALRQQLRITRSGREAIRALIAGDVAAAMVTRAQAEAALAEAGRSADDFELTTLALPGLPNEGWAIGMAIRADDPALAQALADALERIRRSGALRDIYARHGVTLVNP